MKFNRKYDRKHNSQIENYKKQTPMVDRTGYLPMEQRIKQMQQAGISLNVYRTQQYDAQTEAETEGLYAPPFRGLSPDLADLYQLHRDNIGRTAAIKEKIANEVTERRELAKQLLEEAKSDLAINKASKNKSAESSDDEK